MKRVIAALLLIAVMMAVSLRRRSQQPSEPPIGSAPRRTHAGEVNARNVLIRADDGRNASGPTEIKKLDRLYSAYFYSPNPGYTNVLNVLRPLALYDPTTTDLFKDACTFVALRTDLASQEREYESNRVDMLRWILNHTPQDQHSNAVAKFEREAPPKEILELQQADEAIRRVFQDRFSNHHGLNGDAVVTQLGNLTLTNSGPELWIRCDESVSPYPDAPVATYDLITRE